MSLLKSISCSARACRVGGLILMICGLVLMMFIVPCWAWAGILCLAMIAAGLIIWLAC